MKFILFLFSFFFLSSLHSQQKLDLLKSIKWDGYQFKGSRISSDDSCIIKCDGKNIESENIFTGAQREYLKHNDSVLGFDIDEEKKIIAYIDKRRILIFNYSIKKIVEQTELNTAQPPKKIVLSPSSNLLMILEANQDTSVATVTGLKFNRIRIFNQKLRVISTVNLTGQILNVDFLTDGTIIVSLVKNNKSIIQAYYLKTGYSEVLFEHTSDSIYFNVARKSRNVLVSFGGDIYAKGLKVFKQNFDHWQLLSSPKILLTNWDPKVVFMNERADQYLLVSAGGRIQIWNNGGASALAEFEVNTKDEFLRIVRCTLEKNFITLTSSDGQTKIYGLPEILNREKKHRNNPTIIEQRLGNKSISSLYYNAFNQTLSFGDIEGNLYLYDLNIRKKTDYIKSPYLNNYIFHPWDRTILYKGTDALLNINLETGIKREVIKGYTSAFDISPSGLQIAFSQPGDNTVMITDYRYVGLQGLDKIKRKTLFIPNKSGNINFLKFDQQNKIILATTNEPLSDTFSFSGEYKTSLYLIDISKSDSVFTKIGELFSRLGEVAFSPNSAFLAVSNYTDTISIYPLKNHNSFTPYILKMSDFVKYADSLYNTQNTRTHAISGLFFYNDSILGAACYNENVFRYNVNLKKIITPILNEAIVNKIIYPYQGKYFFQTNELDKIEVRKKRDNKIVFSIENAFREPSYAVIGAKNKLIFASKDNIELFNLSSLTIDSTYPIKASFPKFKIDTTSGLLFYSDMGGIKEQKLYTLAPAPIGAFETLFQINTIYDFAVDVKRGLLIIARSQSNGIELTIEDVKRIPFKKMIIKKTFSNVHFRALNYDSNLGLVYFIYYSEEDQNTHMFRSNIDGTEVIPEVLLDVKDVDDFYVDPKTRKAYVAVSNTIIHELRIYDLNSIQLEHSIELYEAAACLMINHNNSKIIIGSKNGYLSMYDLYDYTYLSSFAAHEGEVRSMSASSSGRLVTLGSEGTIKYWDLKSLSQIGNLYFVGDKDFLFVNKDGYYMSTKNGVKAIAFGFGEKVFPVEQLDAYFNRPDIVLKELDSIANAEYIKLYELAFKKRTNIGKLPKVSQIENVGGPRITLFGSGMTNKGELAAGLSASEQRLTLVFEVSDEKFKLKQLQIWVNNVPIYNIAGKNLEPLGIKKETFVQPIILNEGDNKIEISATNEKDVESVRLVRWINYQSLEKDQYTPKTYLFTVAVNEYENKAYNLNYAVNDGRRLRERLQSMIPKGQFVTDSFYNKKATKAALTAIKTRLQKTNVDDKVIILFSGHGTVDTSKFEFYFGTYDINFINPAKRGISYTEIENLLSDIPARNKLILIDACHSGLYDKSPTKNLKQKDTVKINGNQVVIKNTSEITKNAGLIGAHRNTLERKSFELMQEAFWNTQKSDGTFIITASAGDSYAIESSDYNNGIFTYAVVEALKASQQKQRKGSSISVKELSEAVTNEVLRRTKGRQKPQMRKDYIDSDWKIIE